MANLLKPPGLATRSVLHRVVRCLLPSFWLAGCAEAEPPGLPGEIEWRSRHFVYHARAQDPDVCPAVLERLERHLEVIHQATGLPWPEGRVIHYYKFTGPGDYAAAAGCPQDSSGCARDGNAYSFQPLHEHELVHAYFAPLGSPPRILSEGVAQLLSCSPLDFLSAPTEPDAAQPAAPSDIEVLNPERNAPYVLGSTLVSHLVKAYGWEAFLDLYGEPWQSRGAAELEQSLQAIYGLSFDEAWAAATRATPNGLCVAAWACAADPLVPGVAQTPRDSCADSSYRAIAPTEPELLQFEMLGVAKLLRCPDDPGEPIYGQTGFVESGSFAALGAGSYFVATLGDVTLTSQRLDDASFGTECNQLGSLELPDAHGAFLFQPRPAPYFLRLELPRAAELSLRVTGAGPVQICPSCEASDECVEVQAASQLEVSSSVVLHFPAASSQSHLAELVLDAR